MSLITRCPNCLTTFRVVPDQLRISDGWVRCGQCQHVFDANAALLDGEAASPPSPVLEDLPRQLDAVGQTEVVGQPAAEALATDAETDMSPTLASVGEGVAEEPALPADANLGVDLDLGPAGNEGVDLRADIAPMEPVRQLPTESAGKNLSFMRRMPQKSSWQRTSLRVLLAVLAIGLLAALGIQVAVQERDRMAALFPQTKLVLQWLCQRLNCTVSNLRQIESVVIDSSSFNKIRPDAYRLGIVLRNTSAVDIAMPALELTLTDSRDQPVMRRVLLTSEFAPVAALGAASDWTGSVAITVRGNGSDRFSGYRVLAFYP